MTDMLYLLNMIAIANQMTKTGYSSALVLHAVNPFILTKKFKRYVNK